MSDRIRAQKPSNSEGDLDLGIVELLTRALRRIEDPQLCIPTLSLALRTLTSLPTWEVNRVRTKYHDLLDAILHFLSYPLDDKMFSVIQQRWSRPCSCPKGHWVNDALHQLIYEQQAFTSSDTFSDVVNTITEIVCTVIEHIPPGKLEVGAAKNKWPKSSAALLPNGPLNFINMTVRWSQLTMAERSTQTLSTFMIANILSFCPSVLDPLLNSIELRDSIASQLHTLVQAVESCTPEAPRSPKYFESIYHISWFLGCFHRVADTTHHMYWTPVALQMYLDVATLIPLMQNVIEFPNLQRKEHLIQSFLSHGIVLYTDIPEYGDKPPLLSSMADELRNVTSNPVVMLHRNLVVFREYNNCAGPNCYRSPEEVNAPMQKCSGCSLLRYCSKECQKAHWTWQPAKHKRECAKLATAHVLFRHITKENDPEVVPPHKYVLFAQKLKDAGLTSGDITMLVKSNRAVHDARDKMRSSKAFIRS